MRGLAGHDRSALAPLPRVERHLRHTEPRGPRGTRPGGVDCRACRSSGPGRTRRGKRSVGDGRGGSCGSSERGDEEDAAQRPGRGGTGTRHGRLSAAYARRRGRRRVVRADDGRDGKCLVAAGLRAPVCVAVHALFSDTAEQALLDAGAARIATTTSVPHSTNMIDVVPLMISAIRELADGHQLAEAPDAGKMRAEDVRLDRCGAASTARNRTAAGTSPCASPTR